MIRTVEQKNDLKVSKRTPNSTVFLKLELQYIHFLNLLDSFQRLWVAGAYPIIVWWRWNTTLGGSKLELQTKAWKQKNYLLFLMSQSKHLCPAAFTLAIFGLCLKLIRCWKFNCFNFLSHNRGNAPLWPVRDSIVSCE